jgi:hypothetical protein
MDFTKLNDSHALDLELESSFFLALYAIDALLMSIYMKRYGVISDNQ